MKIYISGPLSADTREEMEYNVKRAIKVFNDLLKAGHTPFLPHLFFYSDLNITWEEWINYDLAWLNCCDALYYISPSRGADIELAKAKELNLKIFYAEELCSMPTKLNT